ncbi:kinase-like domain-containing protein [Schizophyllum commune]
MAAPVVGPDASAVSLPPVRPVRPLHQSSLSTTSSSSTGSSILPEVVKEEELAHSSVALKAKHYKHASFAANVLDIIHTINVPTWDHASIAPEDIKVFKVSGSMTNAVFFISCPSIPTAHTLLLRVYGPSSGELISRPRELHTLHILSSRYHIGPRVYGTFANGRVEEYFESTTLSAEDLRNPEISRWIGARMAELHSVDIDIVEDGAEWEIAATANVKSWLGHARDVLSLPAIPEAARRAIDIDAFETEFRKYNEWLATVDDEKAGNRRVFAHNDTQYGNLLRLKALNPGVPKHRQIIVVDFEYAAPNPAAFDIANHFHEWTANYHSDTPHLLDSTRYPTADERRNMYKAYAEHSGVVGVSDHWLGVLEDQVRAWSPASHAISSNNSRRMQISLFCGAVAFYYLLTSSAVDIPAYIPSSLSWYTGATMSTVATPKGWYKRTAPHPAPEQWTPRREALTLAVLRSTKAEPEGFTLALFSDKVDDKHVAVDSLGRVVLVPKSDHDALVAHATDATALPETGMFRNLWQVARPTTGQPIDRILVPKEGGGNAEISVSGWAGSAEEAMPLKRPVEGHEELPVVLKELVGLALEAREEFDSGKVDQAMVSRVKNIL